MSSTFSLNVAMQFPADAQVHGRVLGGKTLADMPTFKGNYKEAERERFLNMVGILLPASMTEGFFGKYLQLPTPTAVPVRCSGTGHMGRTAATRQAPPVDAVLQ